MDNLDLKQLRIFIEIFKTESISQAAINLDIGQPAVSMALAKLRDHFADPLFVRTSKGMQPTPLAEEIISPMRLAFTTITATLNHRSNFDPMVSDRLFGLCITDIGQRVIMPRLLEYCKKHAPSIRIDLSYVSEHTVRDLESGTIDLAQGYIAGLDAGFYQQALFTDRFVCMLRQGHPRIENGRLTMADFERESHLVISTQGSGHHIVDKKIEEMGIQRKVGLRIPNYLGVISSIVDSDYLAIVPERFGKIVAVNTPVQLISLPFKLDSFRVMQHWHGRYANDPGVIWLRKVMTTLFSEH
ncbi:DNA-binding transcriptional LysR family regulator [Herbaspirillum sp. Sphag1AN]|uniref:LysR family transcriptional regulator n=1 Tax=unclassified Herbaspirillum TaxID=2624150 RepID=UPI00161B668D|nr:MULTISPECIES: LysR family transcriptional regulator [unclassified Herbaspirillum]MBB3213063.1 DNA-binding transcriptional LysR family regulator [Herbaspirillum sp. Sphag1AN]MBB3246260.1 DNA-binding transcriptional LysR family regulator [Herbaspirillum sp. Sphag64]